MSRHATGENLDQMQSDAITRPLLDFVGSELPRIVDRAMETMLLAKASVYARGTSLVRPVYIPSAGCIGHGSGTTILVPLDRAALIETLTGLIRWQKYNSRGEARPTSCPVIVAETILARRGDWPFPQLRAIVSAPTLRLDGSILDKTGFDSQSGIFFASKQSWPKISARPTRKDAEGAIETLRNLLSSFPFVGPADQSAAVALILTTLLRPGLPSAPLFGVNAPAPGTGKSKLVDVAAILATGQAAAVMAAPRDEAELQKHVGASLMAGEQFVSLDNVEDPIRSDFLCQVLTQGTVAVRVLGESRTLKLPTAVMFCATGNSLRFAGDLTRRVVMINLDARMERPEERKFESDVIAAARSRRGELVTAGLTILRSFIVNSAPKIAPALGSFEAWSDLVRSALVWLGEVDPLENAEKVREGDPERERIAAVLNVLPLDQTWTVADISKRIEQDRFRGICHKQDEALTEVLADFIERDTLNSRRLGKFLQKQVGRIIDGKRVVHRGRTRDKVSQWTIEMIR